MSEQMARTVTQCLQSLIDHFSDDKFTVAQALKMLKDDDQNVTIDLQKRYAVESVDSLVHGEDITATATVDNNTTQFSDWVLVN